jgi:hypothetical protein
MHSSIQVHTEVFLCNYVTNLPISKTELGGYWKSFAGPGRSCECVDFNNIFYLVSSIQILIFKYVISIKLKYFTFF